MLRPQPGCCGPEPSTPDNARIENDMSDAIVTHVITHDLDDPEQIAEMVRRFYADVAQDSLLGPMFNDVARVDWSAHLPKLTAFWCRALLSVPGYEGNPYRSHQLINAQSPFTVAHFERWLELFTETDDLDWAGPKAEQAKALGRKVAQVHCHQIVGDELDTAVATSMITGPA